MTAEANDQPQPKWKKAPRVAVGTPNQVKDLAEALGAGAKLSSQQQALKENVASLAKGMDITDNPLD